MSLFKVNGIDIPSPVSCTWGFSDLSSDESGRSTRTGAMQKDIIAQKRTLDFTWGILSLDEAAIVAKLCKNSGAAVLLTYPDILENKIIIGQFYTGDLTNGSYIVLDDIYINGLSCSFIEM